MDVSTLAKVPTVLFGIIGMTTLLAASLGCAAKKPIIIPYRSFSEPEDVIHYTMPANCFWAYMVEAPHSREAIGVMNCWGQP